MNITPEQYVAHFHLGEALPSDLTGVCGRVLRGRKPADFEHLAYMEGRRLAWVHGPEQLAGFIGQATREILLGLGQTEEWLDRNLAEGTEWKLAVIPDQERRRADWEGLLAQIASHYPRMYPRLARWEQQLREPAIWERIPERRRRKPIKEDR